MPTRICHILQNEVFSSEEYRDDLDNNQALTAATLEEDLNYIRTVLKLIGGGPTWYQPIPAPESLGELYNDFAVEHYTTAEDPTRAGQHKNITADSVTSSGDIRTESDVSIKNNLRFTDSLATEGWLFDSRSANNYDYIQILPKNSGSFDYAKGIKIFADDGRLQVLNYLQFASPLSSDNLQIDLQQNYRIYSDNISPLGNPGTRVWFDADPDSAGNETGFAFGPKAGGSISLFRILSKNTRVETGTFQVLDDWSFFKGISVQYEVTSHTTNPGSFYRFSGSSYFVLDNFVFFRDTTGTDKVTFDLFNTRIGIGTTTPAETLDVQGNAVFSGKISTQTEYSDIKGIELTNVGAEPTTVSNYVYAEPANSNIVVATANDLLFREQATLTDKFHFVSSLGRFGLNKINPNCTLDVNGDGCFSGNLNVDGDLTVQGQLYLGTQNIEDIIRIIVDEEVNGVVCRQDKYPVYGIVADIIRPSSASTGTFVQMLHKPPGAHFALLFMRMDFTPGVRDTIIYAGLSTNASDIRYSFSVYYPGLIYLPEEELYILYQDTDNIDGVYILLDTSTGKVVDWYIPTTPTVRDDSIGLNPYNLSRGFLTLYAYKSVSTGTPYYYAYYTNAGNKFDVAALNETISGFILPDVDPMNPDSWEYPVIFSYSNPRIVHDDAMKTHVPNIGRSRVSGMNRIIWGDGINLSDDWYNYAVISETYDVVFNPTNTVIMYALFAGDKCSYVLGFDSTASGHKYLNLIDDSGISTSAITSGVIIAVSETPYPLLRIEDSY